MRLILFAVHDLQSFGLDNVSNSFFGKVHHDFFSRKLNEKPHC